MFQVFPLCRLFFIKKKCMCLLEPNDYYPYSMPMKPTIKNNSQNNESCYNLKSTFKKKSLLNFLLALE